MEIEFVLYLCLDVNTRYATECLEPSHYITTTHHTLSSYNREKLLINLYIAALYHSLSLSLFSLTKRKMSFSVWLLNLNKWIWSIKGILCRHPEHNSLFHSNFVFLKPNGSKQNEINFSTILLIERTGKNNSIQMSDWMVSLQSVYHISRQMAKHFPRTWDSHSGFCLNYTFVVIRHYTYVVQGGEYRSNCHVSRCGFNCHGKSAHTYA